MRLLGGMFLRIKNMEPEFTDSARAALLWVLWHHQGGSSPVGQPIRFALGMGKHDRMTDAQVAEAKLWGEMTGRRAGHRSEGDRCVCGGDAPAVRAGCANWVTPNAEGNRPLPAQGEKE